MVCLVIMTGGITAILWMPSDPETVTFAVVSDVHLYDTALGTGGPQFIEDLNADPKMLMQIEEIFGQVVTTLQRSRPAPDFLLISGDLTKDGERINHLLMAAYLDKLEASGIEVFVVPGNHDINNPNAVQYDEYGRMPVDSVDPDEFTAIYANFGYAQAVARDPNSLSYVAEPVSGLWLLALDSCRYGENTDEPVVGGKINDDTLQWILSQLESAKQKNKIVIGMMHHGIVEHYRGQGQHFPDFIIENWDDVGHTLAAQGLNLMFTGHFHAQDITRKTWKDGASLIDIETASLATYPCTYRWATLNRTTSHIALESSIVELAGYGESAQSGNGFHEFARDFLSDKLRRLCRRESVNTYQLDEKTADDISDRITAAFMAHLRGDEIPDIHTFNANLEMIENTDEKRATLGKLLYTLWHDLPPRDNTVAIDMKTVRTVPVQDQ